MDTSFEVLNKILQGEHQSIEQYQVYIGELEASPLRNHLTAILTDHKEHATRISYFIQTNGGHAEEGSGLIGALAAWKTRLTDSGEVVPMDILDHLSEGEEKALGRAIEYSERYLSSAEKELLEPIFSDEHDHLNQLRSLKEGAFGGIH